jgi:hypothetical protein
MRPLQPTIRAIAVVVLAALPLAWIGYGVASRLVTTQAELTKQRLLSSAQAEMEARASTLVLAEAARGPEEWLSFHRSSMPINEDFTPLTSTVLVPSPLLPGATPPVLVHFQFDNQNQLSSPQAPTGQVQQRTVDLYKIDLKRYQPHLEYLEGRLQQMRSISLPEVDRIDTNIKTEKLTQLRQQAFSNFIPEITESIKKGKKFQSRSLVDQRIDYNTYLDNAQKQSDFQNRIASVGNASVFSEALPPPVLASCAACGWTIGTLSYYEKQ